MSEHISENSNGALRERLAHLEARVDSLASRDWVRDLVAPIKDAALSTQHAVTHLSERFEALFAAHDKLLQERAQREREEHEAKLAVLQENTWLHIVKEKWAPIACFIGALIALFVVVGGGFAWWITHYVLPVAPK